MSMKSALSNSNSNKHCTWLMHTHWSLFSQKVHRVDYSLYMLMLKNKTNSRFMWDFPELWSAVHSRFIGLWILLQFCIVFGMYGIPQHVVWKLIYGLVFISYTIVYKMQRNTKQYMLIFYCSIRLDSVCWDCIIYIYSTWNASYL